jgi:hypothetical protein
MAKTAYQAWNPRDETLLIVARADQLATSYAGQGYDLTLRQLYYQFVARGWLPNLDASYDKLGTIVSRARLAGLIDWDHITDRTRNLTRLPSWDNPQDILDAVARQYRTRLWRRQRFYVEVWVEKEALAGVVKVPSERWQVPFFSCRGYVSQSEMHAAAQRLIEHEDNGHKTVILHLGDHDPSGIDMTRDIRDRLLMFGSRVRVRRIALNMDQIEQYQPPPNPAKVTDSRFESYLEEYGEESWELDALDPPTLDALIEEHILRHLDREQWDEDVAAMETEREELVSTSANWASVTTYLRDEGFLGEGD